SALGQQFWEAPVNGVWDEPNNWFPLTGAVPDGISDSAAFVGAKAGTPVAVTLENSRTVERLLFEDNLAPYSLVASGAATLRLAGAAVIEATDAQVHRIAVPLVGSDGLQKLGVGTVLLEGTHSFVGMANVQAGTLRLQGVLSGAAAIDVAPGATLDASSSANFTLRAGQTLTGGGQVTLGGVTLVTEQGSGLEGTLRVRGSVDNHGTIRPGFSGGSMRIDGAVTLGEDGALQLQSDAIDGISRVNLPNGAANLGGRLEFYPDAAFSASPGEEFVVVSGRTLNGAFSMFHAPSVAEQTGLAVEILQTSTATTLRFTDPQLGPALQSVAATNDWNSGGTWSSGALPGMADVVTLENRVAGKQQVALGGPFGSSTAFVHDLTVRGSGGEMELSVAGGSRLSATRSLLVGSQGTLTLEDASAATDSLHVTGGGLLQGSGEIFGDVRLGDGVSGVPATLRLVEADAALNVWGDFLQEADGELHVTVSGSGDATAGRLHVHGAATLGGALIIDSTAYSGPPGGSLTFLTTSEEASGGFNRIVNVGGPSYFWPTESLPHPGEDWMWLSDERGDMNIDGQIDRDDIALFALGLVNPEDYYNSVRADGVTPIERPADLVGDVNFDGRFDIDDLHSFSALINASPQQVWQAVLAAQKGVPEPTSGLFVGVMAVGCALTRRSRKAAQQ
ncbi:MAG: hypothetical protein KDA61_04705, partial [Planctomycetales bacterium]|nr:hypothetical protein [Planctomycetales bacterium]